MDEISYAGNRLELSGETIELRHTIKEVLARDERIIVLQNVPSGTTDNRNVVAYDRGGNALWRIQSSVDEERDNPYVSIEEDDETVIVETWNGMRYIVDEQTGEISDGKIRRF